MPSSHLILCHPLLLLPSIFPSIRVFCNESVLHIRWPSIGASASASVLPMNFQGWFSLGLTGLIYLLSKGLSRVFSSTTVQKHQFFGAQPSLWPYFHISDLYVTFFFIFHCLSVCCSDWIISLILSSKSLMHSSMSVILLFIFFRVFLNLKYGVIYFWLSLLYIL